MPAPRVHRLEQIAAVLLLVAQPVLFFRAVLFRPQHHIPYDIETFHFPLAAFLARSVRQGIFPLWDPFPYGGVPIHADITAQLFYPFTWISILLGNHTDGRKLFYWLEWQIPFHMILAGLFTYWLAREMKLPPVASFLGGTVFQLGCFFASQAQHLSAVGCAAWLPFIVLCLVKLNAQWTLRWMALLAVAIALIIVVGFPSVTAVIIAVSFFTLLALWILRGRKIKFLASAAIAFAWGLCISAVQWISTYQVSRLSIATMRSHWLGTGGGLHWQSLASLVAPDYYHIFEPLDPALYKLPYNFTLLYVYCGLIPLGLMLTAPFVRNNRLARALLLCTLACAIWMLGDSTPLYPFIFTHLPSAFANPLYAEYALVAFSFSAALAAAAALARFTEFRIPTALFWVLALATSVDLFLAGSERPMNTAPDRWTKLNSEYQLAGYGPDPLVRIRNLINTTGPPQRIDFADIGPWNFVLGSELTQVPTLDGNNALMFRRLYLLRHLFCGGNDWERELPVNRFHSPLLRMTNTAMLAGLLPASQAELARSGLKHVEDQGGLALYAVPDPLPRFYLVPSVRPSQSEAETFSLLARPDFAPESEAVVETQNLPSQSLTTGTLKLVRYSPNRVELVTNTPGAAFLASSEPFYPGWTAMVNDRPAPMLMTNGAFRGLYLGAGENRIVMSYWPPRFSLWLTISGLSMLLAVAAVVQGKIGSGTASPSARGSDAA